MGGLHTGCSLVCESEHSDSARSDAGKVLPLPIRPPNMSAARPSHYIPEISGIGTTLILLRGDDLSKYLDGVVVHLGSGMRKVWITATYPPIVVAQTVATLTHGHEIAYVLCRVRSASVRRRSSASRSRIPTLAREGVGCR